MTSLLNTVRSVFKLTIVSFALLFQWKWQHEIHWAIWWYNVLKKYWQEKMDYILIRYWNTSLISNNRPRKWTIHIGATLCFHLMPSVPVKWNYSSSDTDSVEKYKEQSAHSPNTIPCVTRHSFTLVQWCFLWWYSTISFHFKPVFQNLTKLAGRRDACDRNTCIVLVAYQADWNLTLWNTFGHLSVLLLNRSVTVINCVCNFDQNWSLQFSGPTSISQTKSIVFGLCKSRERKKSRWK